MRPGDGNGIVIGFGDNRSDHMAAAEAAVERGKMLVRAGQTENAITAYEAVMAQHPDSEEARFAGWWTAALVEQVGDGERARSAMLAAGCVLGYCFGTLP